MASILVPFSGVLAVLGGLSILLGYRARIGAWLIVLFLIGITPKMHNFWAVRRSRYAPNPNDHVSRRMSPCWAELC